MMIQLSSQQDNFNRNAESKNEGLYITFVDLNKGKAFDTVGRDGLENHGQIGFPMKVKAMVWKFHDDMSARVQNTWAFSGPLS